MNETKIIINGKEVKIRFGSYVMSLLAEDGLRMEDLQKAIQDNTVGFIAKVIYYGAINASKGKKLEDLTLFDIFDWIDEQEDVFNDKKVMDIFYLFIEYTKRGLPKEDESKKKVKTKPKSLNPEKTTAEK